MLALCLAVASGCSSSKSDGDRAKQTAIRARAKTIAVARETLDQAAQALRRSTSQTAPASAPPRTVRAAERLETKDNPAAIAAMKARSDAKRTRALTGKSPYAQSLCAKAPCVSADLPRLRTQLRTASERAMRPLVRTTFEADPTDELVIGGGR